MIKKLQTDEAPTYWTVDFDKLSRFCAFAEMIRMASNPDLPSQGKAIWADWHKRNASIVSEFRHLVDRLPVLGDHSDQGEDGPQMARLDLKLQLTNPGGISAFVKKPKKQRKSTWVEFWNTLPNVPKCREGTAAYDFSRRFFDAHQHYQVGEVAGFVLTDDEKKRIHLKRINKIPKEPLLEKGLPIRSDEEMERHIRQAALAYDSKYAPIKKEFLGGLPQFLYVDGRYNSGGIFSRFLRYVDVAPLLVEDASYEQILKNAQDYELYIIDRIEEMYLRANGRDLEGELTLPELKRALFIAKRIGDEYLKIPLDRHSILAHHFPDYKHFVDWWKSFCSDHLWNGMPINSFDISKDLWRKFIDNTNRDLGYNIMTGERM